MGWVRGTIGGWRIHSCGCLPVREDISELRDGGDLFMVYGFRCVLDGAREKVKSMYDAIGWGHSGLGEVVVK